jgi:hypothetical protein
MPEPPPSKAPRARDVVLGLAGIAGIAAAITLLVLGGRALIDIGGFCAEGGPYEIAVPCPENSEVVFLLGFLGGGAATLLAESKSRALGIGDGTVALLAFLSLFGVIGLESLLAGLDPPGDEPGPAWGWLIMGAIFLAVSVPLLASWVRSALRGPAVPGATAGRRSRLAIPGAVRVRPSPSPPGGAPGGEAESPDPGTAVQAARAGADDVSRDIAAGDRLLARAGETVLSGSSAELVDDLERLARLHDQGHLDDGQFEAAKDELLGRSTSA